MFLLKNVNYSEYEYDSSSKKVFSYITFVILIDADYSNESGDYVSEQFAIIDDFLKDFV